MTLSANIENAKLILDGSVLGVGNTTYSKIGVKVWIFKGEILPVKKQSQKKSGQAPDNKLLTKVNASDEENSGGEVNKDVTTN